MRPNGARKKEFTTALLRWNKEENTRQMPWKNEKDPYRIWISEIILQQTRVEQGWDYYLAFIKAYPTVYALAAADETAVFKLWEGLGYYSRCRNLLIAAKQIVSEMNAVFPNEHGQILRLKGVGPYTAAAIASFAFDLPFAVVDGNVTRVLARYFGVHTPFDSTEGRRFFASLAQELMDARSPATYNQAIMDFGATICKPSDPNCKACPLSVHCVAYLEQKVRELPVRSKKINRKTRWFCYWVINAGSQVLVRKREEKDIWRHLHEYYLLEDQSAFEWSDTEIISWAKKSWGLTTRVTGRSAVFTQQLTHQTIHARFFNMELSQAATMFPGYEWRSQADTENLAFPGIINTFQKNAAGATLLF